MNFFNSIFSEDPEPSNSPTSAPNHPADTQSENPNPKTESSTIEDPWSFGGLIKTISTRSESVIGSYRRDIEEFGSGLLKETTLIRDVASRAVQDLPDSIDAGAAVAQESLESVGQAIDNLGSSVWQGTNKILELQLFDDGAAADSDDNSDGITVSQSNVKKYSWFDTRMREIQADPRTYTEDPDDSEDYKSWKSEFHDRGEEIQKLMEEERLLERIYLELVPVTVDKESFWIRYFYKVDKLKQANEARARIVQRAISGDDDEEDLSWDVEDDDTATVSAESTAVESKNVVETKVDSYDSSKDSDVSIISTQPSMPGEEELGWDEIEDVGVDDGSKVTASGSANVSDLRKGLSAAAEEEDLSWDIEEEEDDEPVKTA